MDLKETEILGDEVGRHWYYRSKARAMMQLLGGSWPTTILDVGAGSGYFSRHLLATTPARSACCVDISYSHDTDTLDFGKPVYFRRSIEATDSDLILLMDVLEHVDDDVGLLSEYVSKAPIGARFLISVPAFQFLWSGHDVFLEHKRRYRLSQIERVADLAGLRVVRSAYYFGLVFPIAAVIRVIQRVLVSEDKSPRSQLTLHSAVTNLALGALCNIELPIMRFNRLAGLTAFCLAEKRSQGMTRSRGG